MPGALAGPPTPEKNCHSKYQEMMVAAPYGATKSKQHRMDVGSPKVSIHPFLTASSSKK